MEDRLPSHEDKATELDIFPTFKNKAKVPDGEKRLEMHYAAFS